MVASRTPAHSGRWRTWTDRPGLPRQAKEMKQMLRRVLPAAVPPCLQILKSIWKLLLRADDTNILLHQTG